MVLGVRVKAGLVHQDVPDGQLALPGADLRLLCRAGAGLEDGLPLIVKFREELGDGVVQGDVVALVAEHVLKGVVDGVHLRVGGQVIEGIGGDGDIVAVTGLDAAVVMAVAVHSAPRLVDHQLAVLHHSQLCAGEAVLHLGLDQIANQRQRIRVHAHILRAPADERGIGDVDGDGEGGWGDGGDLDGVGTVHSQAGDIHLPGAPRPHAGGVNLGIVDKEAEAGHALGGGDVQLALVTEAGEAVQAVHCQRVVNIALPIGEGDSPLPILVR